MSETPMTPEQRAEIAELIGDAKPATARLLEQLAGSVRDRREHEHPKWEDLFCLNLVSFMGERMGPVLRRLLDAEDRIERRRARLIAAEADLLAVRGLLSPAGEPRRIPAEVEIHERVAPAVEWLLNRVAELEAERADDRVAAFREAAEYLRHTCPTRSDERPRPCGSCRQAADRVDRLAETTEDEPATDGITRQTAPAPAGFTRCGPCGTPDLCTGATYCARGGA